MKRWLLIVACPLAITCSARDADVDVSVEDAIVAEVDERFLSFTVDASQMLEPAPLDFASAPLRRLARELAPAILRIGGTDSDRTFYARDATAAIPLGYTKAMLGRTWTAACEFASALDLQIAFTLNAGRGPRDTVGAWTIDRASEILADARAVGCPVALWELGNEVNAFSVLHGLELGAERYSKDLGTLAALRDRESPGTRIAGPASAFWPIIGEAFPILPDFLRTGGASVDVVTWHYYPQQSSRCPLQTRAATVETLLAAQPLDEITGWADAIEALRAEHAPRADVWLGETGHAQCGGEPGVSGTFVSGFWWLDELGLMARRGTPIVARQALTVGRYRLIDPATWEPTADYYASVVWKRTMGARVLAMRIAPRSRRVRIYAHCAKGGGVAFAVVNLDRAPVRLRFGAAGGAEAYIFSSDALTSERTALNGGWLAGDGAGGFSPLVPAAVTNPVAWPARSYGFAVVRGITPRTCGETAPW